MKKLRTTDDDKHMVDSESNPTPRWVKVFGIIAIVLVLLFLIMQLTGGGHGPGRHIQSDGPNNHQTSKELGIQQS